MGRRGEGAMAAEVQSRAAIDAQLLARFEAQVELPAWFMARFRTATGLFRVDLAGPAFSRSSRSRRADLRVGVDVDHPALDQLWSPVPLWNRGEPDPGMGSAAH